MPFRGHHARFFVDSDTDEPIPEFSISPPPPPASSDPDRGFGGGGDHGVAPGLGTGTGLEALEANQARAEKELEFPPDASTTKTPAPETEPDPDPAAYPPPPTSPARPPPPLTFTAKLFRASNLPPVLQWIPPHFNWKGFRPVVRAAFAAWCGLLLLLGSRSEAVLGQAGFLVLVVAAISPPSNPIATVVEQTILQTVLIMVSWAWGCLGLFIAHSVRTQYKLSETAFNTLSTSRYLNLGLTVAEISTIVMDDVYSGVYLETRSSVTCGFFLGVGCGVFLWLRGNLGPGPALFGIIFGIILQIIMFTNGVLFPYAFYSLGLTFIIPFACQQAINLACSFLVFPETLAHQFSDRLIATLLPLQSVIQQQREMLSTNPRSEAWLQFKSIKKGVDSAMSGVGLLGASETNLTREISYARVSGKDLTRILVHMRLLASRSTGFVSFYETVEKHLHRQSSDAKGGTDVDDLIVHLGRSRPNSPDHSPLSTRPNSLDSDRPQNLEAHVPSSETASTRHYFDPSHLTVPSSPPSREVPLGSSPLAPHPPYPPQPQAPTNRNPFPSPYNRTYSAPASHHQSISTPASLSRNSSSNSLADLNVFGPGVPGGNEELEHPVDSHLSRLKKKKIRGHMHTRSGSHTSLPSMLHDILQPQGIRPVGLVESQRYMDIEDFLSNPRDEEHLEEIIRLLAVASDPLLAALDRTLGHLMSTIHRLKSSEKTWKAVFHEDIDEYNSSVAKNAACLEDLERAMAEYREVRRLDVVRPFASLFDPSAPKDPLSLLKTPSHRGLFWAFSYQFSLMKWGEAVLEVAKETFRVEKKRRRPRIWTPEWAKLKFGYSTASVVFEDENPDMIIGLNPGLFSAPRNPDYKPPVTRGQVLGIAIFDAFKAFSKPDVLFGIKSAVLLGVVSLPAYFPTSCYFFATQRGIWVLIMIALTSTQFVGDTTFGFLMRIIGTFLGATVGLLVWYIGAGSGIGNPYGIAATCAVAFPIVFYVRVHYLPPVTAIIGSITVVLCVGYSWQDGHQPTFASVGWGWDVAWKRFVAVMLGITIAFIWSYVPPKSSQKGTVRRTYAKVLNEMGGVICQIISFSHYKSGASRSPRLILQNIALLRSRVAKTTASKGMIKYEVSLRGAWPAKHYASLQILQMELLDLLGQFLGVVAALDSNWTKALLHRSQFSNSRFLGELLTTFQLISTALADSKPLPMLYNPLLERYLRPPEVEHSGHTYGFEPTMEDDIEGIPQHVDLETICSIEYLQFSCGISIAYSIVNRIDRLMFVTKSLVGESYLVYGLESQRNRHVPPREELERKWHGDESRASSMDNLV